MNKINLLQGDCLELLEEIPNDSVDLIITDPPYGIDYSTFRTKSKKLLNDNSLKWVNDFSTHMARVLKKESHMYCFVDAEMSADFILSFRKNGFKVRNLLTIPRAVKGNGGNRIFQQQFEFCIFATLGNKKEGKNFNQTQILKPSESYLKDKRYKAKEWLYRLPDHWHWTTASVHNAKNKFHPTEKNVECLEDMVALSSKENEIVLDPFMGSGTTGVACKNLNRNFIGMELDEGYFNIAKERIENHEVVE